MDRPARPLPVASRSLASARLAALALAALALLVPPPRARAHGGPPTLESIVVDPTDPSRMIAATNFGVLASRDGGATWGWICPGALQLRIDTEDPLVEYAGDGSPMVGDLMGLFRAGGDACDWSHPDAELASVRIGAIARGAGGAVYAGTSEEAVDNAIFASADDGATWSPIHGPTADVWYESLAVAPSDPMRVYAVQNRPPLRAEPWEITLLRSDDAGSSFTPTIVPHVDHEWRLYVLAVDPTDPDRALARLQNLYPGEHERLVLTEDGGDTWNEVLQMTQFLGATFSPDGATAWAGGPVEGLYRSDDGGRTFAPVHRASVRCAVIVGGELWICADDFSDGFAIGRSSDGGETFEPVARLRSITGILDCPAGTTVRTTCPAEEGQLDAILAMAPSSDPDAGPGDPDASVPEVDAAIDGGTIDAGGVAPPSGGCSCRAASGADLPGALGCVTFVALVVARSRRRTSRSRA